MSLDNTQNFIKLILETGYDSTDTEIDVRTGGSSLPDPEFNMVWWDSTSYADPTDDPNVEIVRVTGVSGNTLTVERAQEGTIATDKDTTGHTYKLILGITSKMITDINDQLGGGGTPGGSNTNVQYNDSGAFAGDDNLIWDKDNSVFQVQAGNGSTQAVLRMYPNGTDVFNIDTGIGGTKSLSVNANASLVFTSTTSDILASSGVTLNSAATAGFFRVPGMDGAPVGTPLLADGVTVPIVYDTTNSRFYVYNNGWINVAGTASSITGTSNRITVSGSNVVDISAAYVGQTSITTLGTITSGTWNGTTIAVARGGTGLASLGTYALLTGGTTPTGNIQQVSGLGTSGQVLTSNGAGTLPTWQSTSSAIYSGGTVFNSTAPTSYTDLDLSGTVGSRRVLTYLKVSNASGAENFFFKDKDDSEDVTSPGAGAGASAARIESSTIAYVSVETNGSGVLQWKAGSGVTSVIKLKSYIPLA